LNQTQLYMRRKLANNYDINAEISYQETS
jgi:hypothetical protein